MPCINTSKTNNLLLLQLPESPNFKVELTLNVKQGGGPQSQFYLLDIGSCWKNNGAPCDGDVLTDVTRYSEMIINPQTQAWCSPTNLNACPPYHITPKDKKIYRNDTANFPYGAYHYYCSPGNAMHLEQPVSTCDPYSNPQAQELVQIVPHPIWAEYGYPSKQGEGWIGDPRTWKLDVGGLSSRLYFYQVSLQAKQLETILLDSMYYRDKSNQTIITTHVFSLHEIRYMYENIFMLAHEGEYKYLILSPFSCGHLLVFSFLTAIACTFSLRSG